MTEGSKLQPTIHLQPTLNLLLLHSLLAVVLSQLPVSLLEEIPAKPEVSPTPFLNTLLTAPPRKQLHADFKMLPSKSHSH